MKLFCNKLSLCEAINNVSKAVAVKSTIPSLEGIKIILSDSMLNLTGYDLEIGIKTKISVRSQDSGEFIVNARLFNEIIKRMPTEEIMIEVAENLAITITGGATQYTISATEATEYPDIPEFNECDTFKISQSLLKNMINQTVFAVANNDTKPILTGELFDIEDGTFNLVAIDGYRLAIRTEKINCEKKFKFVVPSKALNEVSKLLKDADELQCEINTCKKHIIFDISGYQVISRLLEGEFHNYKGSIPQSSNTEVIVKTKDLISCLERASLLINERIKSPVRCIFENGMVKMNCSTSIGKINDEISVDITGPKIEIGFNNKYFLDPLKAIEDDKIKLLMNGSNLPMKITPLNGVDYTFLVLPVRLKNE